MKYRRIMISVTAVIAATIKSFFAFFERNIRFLGQMQPVRSCIALLCPFRVVTQKGYFKKPKLLYFIRAVALPATLAAAYSRRSGIRAVVRSLQNIANALPMQPPLAQIVCPLLTNRHYSGLQLLLRGISAVEKQTYDWNKRKQSWINTENRLLCLPAGKFCLPIQGNVGCHAQGGKN